MIKQHINRRDDRLKVHDPVRRQQREDLYLQLSRLILEEKRNVPVEDKKRVLSLIEHKLNESMKQEKKA